MLYLIEYEPVLQSNDILSVDVLRDVRTSQDKMICHLCEVSEQQNQCLKGI